MSLTQMSPPAHVTKTPGYNDTIELFPIGTVPELQHAIHVIYQDYLELIHILCTTPGYDQLGERRIRRALSAAVKGWSPAEYAAHSELEKDQVVEEVLGQRRANDGRWPTLLFYLGGRVAGTLGMSPSVSGELKLSESGVAESPTTTEWWDKSWNDDSSQWPTAYGWTAHCSSSQSNFLYLAGGYAVHLTKHQIDQQESIRVHAKATILHEIAHYIRNSVGFYLSCYNNQLSCL